MRIQSIEVWHIRLPMQFCFKTARGLLAERDTMVIKFVTDDGTCGYGENVAFTLPFYTKETLQGGWDVFARHIGQALIGFEWKPRQGYAYDKWRKSFPMLCTGLDIALWDAYGKEKKQPAMSLLFPEDTLKDTIAGGLVIGQVPIPDVLSLVRKAVADGYKRIKLKVSPKDGIDRIERVRQIYDGLLAVDANQSYVLADRQALAIYDRYNLVCIEEPFSDATWTDIGHVQAQMQTPLCLDESTHSYEDVVSAYQAGGLSMLNIKAGRLGGLEEARKAIYFCRRHSISFWIGSMVESGISKWVHAHLAALGDTCMPGDLSDSARYFKEEISQPPLHFKKGNLERPQGSGFGYTVDEERVEAHSLAHLIFE